MTRLHGSHASNHSVLQMNVAAEAAAKAAWENIKSCVDTGSGKKIGESGNLFFCPLKKEASVAVAVFECTVLWLVLP